MELSNEQKNFIDIALKGRNILVDACIGSGKTTSIQQLCNQLPKDKKILYLTYNRLLKVDAKSKIKLKNVAVHNYDGFAFWRLKATGSPTPSQSDLVQTFNRIHPYIDAYDILIIDEYQDIKEEHSYLLEYIKNQNTNMQIIAVGDMKQKIYDNTTLNIEEFIDSFLEDYELLEFTQCFRLSKNLADMLGRIWHKQICGVNDSCKVSTMYYDDVAEYLSNQKIEDILCLGSRTGDMAHVLNKLEGFYPTKFNKKTVYASIRDGDVMPNNNCAIFTTFDASKGLERKVCVIFDYTEEYWTTRINKPNSKYEILRNIFCVAASRGKSEIIFVQHNERMLSEDTLLTYKDTENIFEDVNISEMFDFKYKEDIEDCYSLINKELVRPKEQIIDVMNHDGLIDLSPCIGIYQEAIYFNQYDIDKQIDLLKTVNHKRFLYINDKWDIEKKILAIIAFETQQKRYIKQVKPPFITNEQKMAIKERLSEVFNENEIVQKSCNIKFYDNNKRNSFEAKGRCDVIKNDEVYELKFTDALSHEHYLQCACYMIGLNIDTGYLWNVKTNEMYKITIPNKKEFLNGVARAITKRHFKTYN